MKKRYYAILAAAVIALAMSSCGKKDDAANTNTNNTTNQTTETENNGTNEEKIDVTLEEEEEVGLTDLPNDITCTSKDWRDQSYLDENAEKDDYVASGHIVYLEFSGEGEVVSAMNAFMAQQVVEFQDKYQDVVDARKKATYTTTDSVKVVYLVREATEKEITIAGKTESYVAGENRSYEAEYVFDCETGEYTMK